MSELKATPGPWVKDFGGTIGHIKSVAKGQDGTPTVAYYNVRTPSLTDEEKEANGYLIEAVHDLYEALEVFAACADELDATADTEKVPDDKWAKFRLLASDYRKARAALAKARGEQL